MQSITTVLVSDGQLLVELQPCLPPGWILHAAQSVNAAQQYVRIHNPQVGLVWLSPEQDIGSIEQLLHDCSHMEWLALIDRSTLAHPPIQRVLRENCFDYLTCPVDSSRLRLALGHALGMARLRQQTPASAAACATHGMVGVSTSMRSLCDSLAKQAKSDASVLITGESGTGKEMMARAIHMQSTRRDGPFIAVNCGALPANLVQSELFGHEKGAFTGAAQRKIGRIEAASGGTIFLDEIGDLPLDMQVSLLRFLQEKTIERVGSHQSVQVDVRVVAATHVDLEKAVREGRFREDLYYRLNVLHLHMPPLRERQEDIPLLAEHFFERYGAEKRPQLRGISRQAIAAMQVYDWPGNVREMINRVRRALVMADGRLIQPADLGLAVVAAVGQGLTLEAAKEVAERNAVAAMLARRQNNVTRSARDLGVSRVTLYRLAKKYGLIQAN